MKVTLVQEVQLKNLKNGCKEIRKTFDSNIMPHEGDFVADSVWQDSYEYRVSEIVINYEENNVHVFLDPVILETNNNEALNEYYEMVKLHNWE